MRSGYEKENLVKVVYEKTKQYRRTIRTQSPLVFDLGSLRTLIALNLTTVAEELNVIDFGGACGAHYFIAKALLGEKPRMRWHVVETRRMTNAAKALEDGQLRFFDNLNEAITELGRVDLLFSSGALQYVPEPYETLRELTDCGAKSIFITRMGLTTDTRELITIQTSNLSANGPGPLPERITDVIVRYPVSFVRKDRFEEILSRNYSIRIQFDEEKGAHFIGGIWINLHGYLGEQRTNK